MKKIYLIAVVAIATFALSSCSKDTPVEETGNNIPTSFTQKVLLEEFSGAWCGWCPDGAYRLETMVDENNGKLIGVTIHQGDGMQISQFTALDNEFNVTGFPSGMVGRRPSSQDQKVPMSRTYWESNVMDQLGEIAKCGLKIDASNGEAIKVTAAFNQTIPGDLRMTVYVLEDEVTGTGAAYDQANYYANNANFPTHPYYSQPATIKGYKHMKTLRKVLTGSMGDAIETASIKAGGTVEKTFSLTVPAGWNSNNVSIIAFVNEVGTDGKTHKILNVQEVKLGASKGWD